MVGQPYECETNNIFPIPNVINYFQCLSWTFNLTYLLLT